MTELFFLGSWQFLRLLKIFPPFITSWKVNSTLQLAVKAQRGSGDVTSLFVEPWYWVWLGGQHHAFATLSGTHFPTVQETGWPRKPIWTGAENLPHTETRTQNRPALCESLYRLRYPGPLFHYYHVKKAATGPHPKPDDLSPHPCLLVLSSKFNTCISFPFPSSDWKFLWIFHLHLHAPHAVHLILLDLTNLITASKSRNVCITY
jgi:hypothetical protein